MIPAALGKILWVDLTAGLCTEETVPDAVYESYLGGIGLAAYYLYHRIPAGADALGPENVLAFVPGLLTGTGTMMTGRWMAAAKSPLTGTWGDSNCGGTLAPAIRQSGYDGIFFSGISKRPVYLLIAEGKVELIPAEALWGLDAIEAEQAIKQAHAQVKRLQVACIGQAGEKLSLMAGISNDGGRMAARGGVGAVMGSKRLKAIALSGSAKVGVSDRAEITRLNKVFVEHIKPQSKLLSGKAMRVLGDIQRILPVTLRQDGLLYKDVLRKWGTTGLNEFSILTGDAPLRNWAGTDSEFRGKKSRPIDPDALLAQEKQKYHCSSCPVGCGGISVYGNGKEIHKPEYETVLSLGGLLLNEDAESLFVMTDKLNRAGMDSISAGSVIAFAIECFQHGILTAEDTGGLLLNWGDTASIMALLEKIIQREGIGDLLADGVHLASQRIGNGSERFAVVAGKQETPMHDGRNDPGFALHYAVEPAPGRHTIGSWMYYEMFELWRKDPFLPEPPPKIYLKSAKYKAGEREARMSAANSQFKMVVDATGLCLFGGLIGAHRMPVFEWLNAATGWDRTPAQYLEAGRRIQSVRQAFNQKQGAPSRAALHPRLVGQPPQKSGANKGRSVNLEALVPLYWRAMGWDEHGWPREDVLPL